MPGVNATIGLSIRAKQTGSGDLGTPGVLIDIAKELDFSAGTATVNQSNILFSDTRTLLASATENLDLAGVLADALGSLVNAAEIVAVYFAAAPGNTNEVQITRPAANGVPLFLAAGDGLALGPGDFTVRTYRNGVAVVAGTGDLLTVTNGGAGTSVTYDVIILGRTVAA
jgi:hypothetical protein